MFDINRPFTLDDGTKCEVLKANQKTKEGLTFSFVFCQKEGCTPEIVSVFDDGSYIKGGKFGVCKNILEYDTYYKVFPLTTLSIQQYFEDQLKYYLPYYKCEFILIEYKVQRHTSPMKVLSTQSWTKTQALDKFVYELDKFVHKKD